MGERGQIKINGVYLYTHWGGYHLKNILQESLKKKWRWGDEEYLARIIFDVMVGDDCGKTDTGNGLGITKHGDLDYPLLEVKKDEVIEHEDEYTKKPKTIWTFDNFIEEKFKED